MPASLGVRPAVVDLARLVELFNGCARRRTLATDGRAVRVHRACSGAILGAGPLGPVVKHRVVQLGGELVLVTRLGGEGFKVVSVRVMYWLCEAASVSAGYPTPPAQLPPEKCGLGLPL